MSTLESKSDSVRSGAPKAGASPFFPVSPLALPVKETSDASVQKTETAPLQEENPQALSFFLQKKVADAATSAPPVAPVEPEPRETPELESPEPDPAFGLSAAAGSGDGADPPSALAPTILPDETAAVPGWIVEDDHAGIRAGQLRKSEFLQNMREAVAQTVAAEAVGTSWRTEDCPWIAQCFAYLDHQTAAYIEAVVRRYAPETHGAATAQDYTAPILERVRYAAAHFFQTGELHGLPGIPEPVLASSADMGSGILLRKATTETATVTDSPTAIQRQLGAGQAFGGDTRSRMEHAFGADFSGVNIHTDAAAGRLARQLNARAFTVGSEVAFAPDEYHPGTLYGDALLAHELAHVQQQRGASAIMAKGENEAGALETDADNAAVGVVARLWGNAHGWLRELSDQALPRLKTGLRLQRCTDDSPPPNERAPRETDGTSVESIPAEGNLRIALTSDQTHRLTGHPVEFSLRQDMMYRAPGSVDTWRRSGPWRISGPGDTAGREVDVNYGDFTPDRPGSWRVEVSIRTDTGHRFRLWATVNITTAESLAENDIANVRTDDVLHFRAGMESELLRRRRYARWSQVNESTTPPYIRCAQPNPAGATADPDRIYHTYEVSPTAGANRFRWFVRMEDWAGAFPRMGYTRARPGDVSMSDRLAQGQDITFLRRTIDGEDAWVDTNFSDTPSRSFRFIMMNRGVYTIVCEELNEDGTPSGRQARYIQFVLPDAEFHRLEHFQHHIQLTDRYLTEVRAGTEVPLRAVYVNNESGDTMAVSMYLARAATGNDLVLLDLTPGASPIRYDGSDLQALQQDFDRDNAYPTGVLMIEFPANRGLGISQTIRRRFDTRGASVWSSFASGTGWASLGLAGLGLLTTFTPLAPLAPALFVASAAAGAASGLLSLHDRLQQAEVNRVGVALDLAGVAASILGATMAFRALRYGVAAATTPWGVRLLWTGYASDAVTGVFLTADAVQQIDEITRSSRSRGEQIGAIVRLLAALVAHGSISVLQVRQMGQIRTMLNETLGETLVGRLTTSQRLQLALLDRETLQALHGAEESQLNRLLSALQEDAALIDRLRAHRGRLLPALRAASENGVTALEGALLEQRLLQRGAARPAGIIQSLTGAGLRPAELSGLSDEVLNHLIAAEAALARGNITEAIHHFDQMGAAIGVERLPRLETRLASTHNLTDPAVYRNPVATVPSTQAGAAPVRVAPVRQTLYYGTSEETPRDVFEHGLGARGSNTDLLNQVQQRSDRAFRGGNTSLGSQGGAAMPGPAHWAGEGGVVFKIDGVASWDTNAALEGRVGVVGQFGGNPMRGEGEQAFLAHVPRERIQGYYTVTTNRLGVEVVLESSFVPNPHYRPLRP